MDYTQSDAFATHGPTSQKLHQDDQPAGTIWSADDANSVMWSLMEVVKEANETPQQFDADTPATYQVLLNSIKKLVANNGLEAAYPVGSIYMNVNSTNPATLLGFGTWQPYAEGRVIIGEGQTTDSRNETRNFSANSASGEFAHANTALENGPHSHGVSDPGHDHELGFSTILSQGDSEGSSGRISSGTQSTNASATGISINSSGQGQAHNNMQPYIVCYVWRRSA